MSTWWSYRPGDFLMFAPRTYWRLFELHNDAWWPLPWVCALAGLAVVVWLWRRPDPTSLSVAMAVAAAAWAFTGWAFVWQRFAPINSAASVFAVGFFIQSGALAVLAAGLRGSLSAGAVPSAWRRRIGLALLGWAMVGQPLLAAASGRPWLQAEVFAMAPDPTAIATLGLLLWLPPPTGRVAAGLRLLAWSLAIFWCAISAATLWTMGAAQGWVTTAAAVLALTAAWLGRRGDRGHAA